jgi:polyisoprenoid-binding protein YceI
MKNLLLLVFCIFFFSFSLKSYAKNEKYTIDPYHTNVNWKVSHFGFSSPSGKFTSATGYLLIDKNKPSKSSVEIIIDSKSLSTGLKQFDEHLSSSDFFNTEKYQQINFKSTKIEVLDNNTAKIYGNLTLLGVTKQIVLETKLNKIGVNDYSKKETAGFSAKTTIKRSDFGMSKYSPSIGEDVFVDIEVEFYK